MIKKIFLVLIIAFVAALVIFMFFTNKPQSGLKKITINGTEILVEIADSSQERAKGLSGRESLPQNQGMFFIFETPDRYSFWMKEMLIPLDFVWIKDSAVVQINENIQPQDFQPPRTLTPDEEADKVLELNAGTIQRLNIKIGDELEF